MACAQCHDHKYDPLSQEEYFQLFAIFNNTEDSDKRNEAPFVSIYSEAQKKQRRDTELKVASLEKELNHLKATALDGLEPWVKQFEQHVPVKRLKIAREKNVLSVRVPPGNFDQLQVAGVDPGRVTIKLRPQGEKDLKGRFVRVTNVGKGVFLHLAEVQVFSNGQNIAPKGKAKQSSTDFGGPANYGNDGNTSGDFAKKTVTHTAQEDNPWWEVDLGSEQPIGKLVIWNRTGAGLAERLKVHRVEVLDANRKVIWKEESNKVFPKNVDYALDGARLLPFVPVPNTRDTGLLRFKAATTAAEGDVVEVTVKDLKDEALIISIVAGALPKLEAALPKDVHGILSTPVDQRSAAQMKRLKDYFAANNPKTVAKAKELDAAKKQLAGMKGTTTVPVMREMAKGRETHIQLRGNYQQKDKRVYEGVPTVFGVPTAEKPNRLQLADWILDERNPLTARVIANRYWESIFGTGLVRTSEEFGSQGELPTHPALLDWLATELVRMKWDTKAFLKLLVTSAAYRQDSRATAAHLANDPANRFYARGPRLRLTAEMIRDQAMSVSGLLSGKMYGVPVKPYQPSFGVSAAFGPGMDWKTSAGEDKYRRGIYTHWRRTNPYPSMAAFDAPNRNVCTVRRVPTNTPLQALVTMNDPVYVEASQALARRIVVEGGVTPADRVAYGLRLCLSREPKPTEVNRLVKLFNELHADYKEDPAAAKLMSTDPLGPLPDHMRHEELAAWTIVGNVLLNLDEMFMKR